MGRKQSPSYGPEEFRAFLAWLNSDPGKAGEDYNRLIRRLHLFFEGWHYAAGDAAELADLSIDRAIKKLLEQPDLISRDAAGYVLNVARYILLEHSKRPRPATLQVDPADSRSALQAGETDRFECLERCLSQLPNEDHDLLRKYYLYEGDRAHARRLVVEEVGKRAGAIRVRVFRICKGLEECIDDCMETRVL